MSFAEKGNICGTLFEAADTEPRTLSEAIKEVLNIDYKPKKNGKERSNALGSDAAGGSPRGEGGPGDTAPGERAASGAAAAERGGGAAGSALSGEGADGTANGGSQHGTQKSQPASLQGDGNNVSSQIKQKDNGRQEKAADGNHDGQPENNGSGVVGNTTRSVSPLTDRGVVQVYGKEMAALRSEHLSSSERNRRGTTSERLVELSKKDGTYIPFADTKSLGDRLPKSTGESMVYINADKGKVYKVKDPYAKAAMKNGVDPEDAIFEHLVHNLLFPETRYTLEGISDVMGDVRIVLSQDYIKSVGRATQEQIEEELAKRGLVNDGKYSYGNEYVSVTDVEGDNVLVGEDGTLYFIDPIINFKKPLKEVIDGLSSKNTKQGEEKVQGPWYGSAEEMPNYEKMSRTQKRTLLKDAAEAYRKGNEEATKDNDFFGGRQNEMTYEDFAKAYREEKGDYFFKQDEPFLPALYEHLTNKLNAGLDRRSSSERGERKEERGERNASGKAQGQALVKGEKWASTGVPEKFKGSKKSGDSHDITWYVGKKKYGSTTAERDLIEALTDKYGNYTNVWNAYENGEFTLGSNEAAILKASLEAGKAAATAIETKEDAERRIAEMDKELAAMDAEYTGNHYCPRK